MVVTVEMLGWRRGSCLCDSLQNVLQATANCDEAAGEVQPPSSSLTCPGLSYGHTIYLGANAAGWGWFVDPTPNNDSEFIRPGNQGEQHRMDLLTVLEHEIGHLLGKEHEAGGVMQETLAPGIRNVPT